MWLLNILFVATAARPTGAAAALSHVGSASLFGFGFSAALQLQSFKNCKNRCTAFPRLKMSSHSETFVLISDVGANKRRNVA